MSPFTLKRIRGLLDLRQYADLDLGIHIVVEVQMKLNLAEVVANVTKCLKFSAELA